MELWETEKLSIAFNFYYHSCIFILKFVNCTIWNFRSNRIFGNFSPANYLISKQYNLPYDIHMLSDLFVYHLNINLTNLSPG